MRGYVSLPPVLAVLAVLALALLGVACGTSGDGQGERRPQVGVRGEEREAAQDLGFPVFATKNTTRVGGADPVADAAGAARAAFPSTQDKPPAVGLVDGRDWRSALPAAALLAEPLGAPVLLSEGEELPPASAEAISALDPGGARQAAGAQVVRVGDTAEVDGLRDTEVAGAPGPELAANLDRFLEQVRGRTTDSVIVVGSEDPRFAMPAAAWAARSGDPILFVERDAVPAVTRRALQRHQQPDIYVLGPERAVSARTVRDLRRLGTVKRIAGEDPVTTSVEFARYVDGDFGWGVVDPGHGLAFVNADRPLDAIAAAPFAATGSYAPLLLHDGGPRLPRPLESYLLDIQPGFRRDPVRGVYNHGWIIGDETAMSAAVQSRIDALLQIVPEETDG